MVKIIIKNATNTVLNISLFQLTPLYYRNKVHPGQSEEFHVGRVWFSIVAKLWTEDNEYQTIRGNVIPIAKISALCIGGVITFVLPFAIASLAVRGVALAVPAVVARMGRLIVGAAVPMGGDVLQNLLRQWTEHSVIRSHGWYMKPNRVFEIRGGPTNASYDPIDNTQTVLIDDPNVRYELIEIK